MASALSIMKNHLLFPCLRESRCITALAAELEEMFITFVMEYENYTFQEALQALADRAGVDTCRREEYSKEAREQADLRSQTAGGK